MVVAWFQNYAITLNAQLRAQLRRPDDALFGTQLSEAQYGALSDEQIAQLYELFQVSRSSEGCKNFCTAVALRWFCEEASAH